MLQLFWKLENLGLWKELCKPTLSKVFPSGFDFFSSLSGCMMQIVRVARPIVSGNAAAASCTLMGGTYDCICVMMARQWAKQPLWRVYWHLKHRSSDFPLFTSAFPRPADRCNLSSVSQVYARASSWTCLARTPYLSDDSLSHLLLMWRNPPKWLHSSTYR